MTGQMSLADVVDVHLHKAGVKRSPKVVATEFRMANPEAFAAIVCICLDDVNRGHKPSIAYCFEYLRRRWLWSADVRLIMAGTRVSRPENHVYSLDHTGRSALVRMLEAEYPRLNGAFRKRHCSVDPKEDTSNATPKVSTSPQGNTDCPLWQCMDVAQFGTFMCTRCENTTPHKEVAE